LQQIPYVFSKKQESFELKSKGPIIDNPLVRKFDWHDPYKVKTISSQVMVVGFRNE
jgi:hypothetical protein